jgi:hypothetical protein
VSLGEDTAAICDTTGGDEDAVAAFLEQMAGGGPALELAVGTAGWSTWSTTRGTTS